MKYVAASMVTYTHALTHKMTIVTLMHAPRVKNLGSDHQKLEILLAIVINFLPTSICGVNLISALLAFISIVYVYKCACIIIKHEAPT